jgi:hypothetical protein
VLSALFGQSTDSSSSLDTQASLERLTQITAVPGAQFTCFTGEVYLLYCALLCFSVLLYIYVYTTRQASLHRRTPIHAVCVLSLLALLVHKYEY